MLFKSPRISFNTLHAQTLSKRNEPLLTPQIEDETEINLTGFCHIITDRLLRAEPSSKKRMEKVWKSGMMTTILLKILFNVFYSRMSNQVMHTHGMLLIQSQTIPWNLSLRKTYCIIYVKVCWIWTLDMRNGLSVLGNAITL